MPRTRKKVIKTVYKDEDDSEAEKAAGDFSDSGSDADIPEESSSDEDIEAEPSSADEFDDKPNKRASNKFSAVPKKRKTKFAKDFINKINRQSNAGNEIDVAPALFSVKDLTDEDKLLPSVLNLSESDSSDDESPKVPAKKQTSAPVSTQQSQLSDSETEAPTEYKDVWAQNVQADSEEVAKKTFMELEQHKTRIEETKASILNYQSAQPIQTFESDVKDLLALGEEAPPEQMSLKKRKKAKKARDDSDSEMEDWEEVNEAKTIPQQGIQLIVDFPDAAVSKRKKVDVEMMMKRKINRVKKEYQVYMHKVHVLSWLGHGNYISRILNDQEVLAAALSLVPSKECYPGERVDMKYIEQITTWYKDKLSLKQDKNEDKFKPKAPPLKEILQSQIKTRTVTAKKYLVFIFVSMLRAIGLQCRIMFNFVTLPIKPPSSELCSLSMKQKDEKNTSSKKKEDKTQVKLDKIKNEKPKSSNTKTSKKNIPQVDGNYDSSSSSEMEVDSIPQLDGNDDVKTRRTRSTRTKKNVTEPVNENDDVSPPKRARKEIVETTTNKPEIKGAAKTEEPQKRKRVTRNNQTASGSTPASKIENVSKPPPKKLSRKSNNTEIKSVPESDEIKVEAETASVRSRKTRNDRKQEHNAVNNDKSANQKSIPPKIIVTDEKNVSSKYFENEKQSTTKRLSLNRTRSETANPPIKTGIENKSLVEKQTSTKSAPRNSSETSKYFNNSDRKASHFKTAKDTKLTKKEELIEDKKRVSHRDLLAKNKTSPKMDVKCDLVDIIKKRVREAKEDSKKGKVKAKVKQESGEDSDYLPEEEPKQRNSESDEDFKPTKISPRPSTSLTKTSSKPSTSRKVDRRVLSSDIEESPKNRIDVWCEVFVEELEQWIPVDVIRAKVHCTKELYQSATHPVCYIVGWDNNNYLKDLTRRYVPHWNTVTRKQRAEPVWWETAIKPWTGPSTARDREENEQLNRMQMEAPLPTSIGEYKNHPLYALKRHLLKFEALYPPDAAVLGFVRKEPVYARECVYVCQSRDKWLKEAKVVRLGEKPYKVVKARPKWDRLSNKCITDKPLEVFGPWQVQDYEPPVAENGIVPRNAYGNVELFKECMLPKGTVHIKLPGLNRVAKKLDIDCAPAMTGFDFNGGWSHPVYDGFVVCEEFGEIVTEAWLKDQEEQERKEREKIELRVYGNWKRLIRGLRIKERLKDKYGFEEPAPPPEKKKRAPKYVAKKT